MRLAISVLALSFALAASPAAALQNSAVREIANAPELLPENEAPSKMLTAAAVPATPTDNRLLDLKVEMIESKLYNPNTGLDDKVLLRGYTGKGMLPDTPLVSPEIEIKPGETVRISLDNKLPTDPSCLGHPANMNMPHCFNGTNLHTHGLWVNPAGNGDNVLLSINPGVAFQYEYNVPSDHPSGTFWYHTHRHGSTALQVSSGMAGALIIRGDRMPTPTANGDIDTLLKGMPERVLVMQQIQYGCYDAAGKIKTNKDGSYYCGPRDVGEIRNIDGFGPGSWGQTGRYSSFNGVVMPTFRATQGTVERWRMIHGGVRDTIKLTFAKRLNNKTLKLGATALDIDKFVESSCAKESLPIQLIAADGLTMAQAQASRGTVFQPGYRFDALVAFPEDGQYCVLDMPNSESGSLNRDSLGRKLMGYVEVAKGTPFTNNPKAYVRAQLIDRARMLMPANMRDAVVASLTDEMKFTQFVPHPTVEDGELTGTQELTFRIDISGPTQFEVGNTLNSADTRPYDPARLDRQLPLGGVEEWTLQSHFVSHPFHIHVNPFQIVSITNPKAKNPDGSLIDLSLPGQADIPDPTDGQYAGLHGVWKDTLWIKSLFAAPGDAPPGDIYTVKVRTRYQRYIGEYVLHCHILDHEDQGMMQNVEVVLPQAPFDKNNPAVMHAGH